MRLTFVYGFPGERGFRGDVTAVPGKPGRIQVLHRTAEIPTEGRKTRESKVCGGSLRVCYTNCHTEMIPMRVHIILDALPIKVMLKVLL